MANLANLSKIHRSASDAVVDAVVPTRRVTIQSATDAGAGAHVWLVCRRPAVDVRKDFRCAAHTRWVARFPAQGHFRLLDTLEPL